MIYLKNDYSMGAHPKVLEALVKTNLENTDGYGVDDYCGRAKETIKNICQCDNMDIYFTMAGTQTNLTSISSILRPHQAIISASTGHICVHEAGAIEATGHKIIHVDTKDGKLRPEDIEKTMEVHEDFHWVMPKAIYISNLTETGIFYTLEELKALRKVCDKYQLYIYLDGARLPMALTVKENDVCITDLPKLCDIFYIGGTKCGLLFGEAVCIVNQKLKEDFSYIMKQKGAVLAKGRLLGVQFDAIMKDNLYFDLGAHCNKLAMDLAKGIREKGYDFAFEPCSNLVFPIFPNDKVKELEEKVMFELWEKYPNETTAIRLVTSWGTREEEIQEFLSLI